MNRRPDSRTLDLFDDAAPRSGALGCAAEVAAALCEALERARSRGMSREDVAHRMGQMLGEKISAATLNGYCAASHEDREPSFRRAMAFDAAVGEGALLDLYVRKLGFGRVITDEQATLLEWAELHQEERRIAERKKALQAMFKATKGAAR